MTDGGSSFDAIFQAVLPGVPRMLCTYHIGENVKRHLAKELGDDYTAFHAHWKRIMDHMRTEDEFESEWRTLLSTNERARPYLTKQLYPDRAMWCSQWTRRYTAFGARTTQRCESVNRVLKHYLLPSSLSSSAPPSTPSPCPPTPW